MRPFTYYLQPAAAIVVGVLSGVYIFLPSLEAARIERLAREAKEAARSSSSPPAPPPPATAR
jgi:hypothetical protein